MQDVCKELKAAISAFSWQSAERKYDKYRLDQRDAETARAAKEMGRLIGKSGSCHTLRISAEGTQAFGTAAKGLRQAAEKMCESAGELERKMRLHRRAIQKSPTMDAAEREALDGTHAAYAGAEVLTARAQSLDRLAGRLAEYQALRGKI